MFIIVEHNGDYVMGFVTEFKSGEVKKFKTQLIAERYAIKNCAFEFKIIEL